MGCPQKLKRIENSCKANVGGILTKIYVLNRDDFEGVTMDATDETIETINIKEGAKYATFEFRKQTANMVSNWTINDADGIRFVQTDLTLKFAQMETKKRVALTALMLGEFIVLVTDANNHTWLLGKDQCVTATAGGGDSGTNASDPNNYTITLTDISKEYPYEFSGDLKTLPIEPSTPTDQETV